MKKILISLLLTVIVAHAQPVYFGTAADGIYLAHFDKEKGTLSEPSLAAKYARPGFLILHPEKPILYAIGGKNQVASFTVAEDHSLTLLNEIDAGGTGPCHLAIDPSAQTIAIAHYSSGSVVTIRLAANGQLGNIVSNIKIEGSGPNESRQTKAHTHGVYFDKANRFLIAPDLGADKTLIFKFDPKTSTISANTPEGLIAPPGSGPRHMAFSPDEKNAYIINELTNTITVAEFDKRRGAFKEIQTINTLPKSFTNPNTTAEIEVHSNGKFVYGSNRGQNTIAVYKRDADTGKLTLIQTAPCGGITPRHFIIDPSGKWLVCANAKSDSIAVLSLDPKTGLLGEPTITSGVPKPFCVLFR